jgi:nicotinamidase-related amidase
VLRTKNSDLHGAAPHRSRVALLLVDVINAMDFPEGKLLARHAAHAAKRIAVLKQRAKAARVPVVYANDNYGQWRSDFRATIQNALAPGMPGRDIARLLSPDDDDYFVLKPKHSGFYNTTLDLLLDYLQTRTVILTGMATDVCVLFTAADAYMRDLRVIVPSDCVTALTPAAHRAALAQMRSVLKAQVVASASLDLARLARSRRS